MGIPTHDELCKAAYRFWEERGCPDGSPEIDWQRAEEELGRLDRTAKHGSHGHVSPSEPREEADDRARGYQAKN